MKYQICVSGSAKGATVDSGKIQARELGEAIAKSGHTLLTGATTGLPNTVAEAYKKSGGHMSMGLSPASTKIEHVLKYHLPVRAYDAILYTGLHYAGRDTLLVTSADAVICLGGRMGTLHELTLAMETDTPLGFLEGAGGTSEEILEILQAAGRRINANLVFDTNAERLLKKLEEILNKKVENYTDLYR